MLSLKTVAELKRYLQTRRDMAKRQGGVTSKRERTEYPEHTQGMLYAYGEAIRAVEALEAQEAQERAEHDDKRESELMETIGEKTTPEAHTL